MGEIPDECTTVTLVLRTEAAAESSKSNRSRNMAAVCHKLFLSCLSFPFLCDDAGFPFLSAPFLSLNDTLCGLFSLNFPFRSV